jgi:hypothetical protein
MTRADHVKRGTRYYEMWYGFWGFYNVYANYRPGAVGHDNPVNIIRDYSTICQEEGRLAFHLLDAGFAGSGWKSQSIYALYNTTAVSTTHILAYAQNTSMPIYTLNQSNLNDTLPLLNQPDWVKDWVRGTVKAGYVVIIPEGWIDINDWHGTGWTELDPTTGAGGYLIVGVMTYMNTGEAGNTSIRLGPEHITVGGHAAQPMDMEWAREKFGNLSEWLKEQLGLANITKDEAKAEAARQWFSIAVGAGFSLVLAGLPFFTVTGMLALIPLVTVATWIGPEAYFGFLVGEVLKKGKKRLSVLLTAYSLGVAMYYTKMAYDPGDELYLVGYSQSTDLNDR